MECARGREYRKGDFLSALMRGPDSDSHLFPEHSVTQFVDTQVPQFHNLDLLAKSCERRLAIRSRPNRVPGNVFQPVDYKDVSRMVGWFVDGTNFLLQN